MRPPQYWFLVILLSVSALAFVLLRHGEPLTDTDKAAQQRQVDRWWANEIAQEIKYIYDERTGLCYAYQAQKGYGGPTLSLVPYERVKNLLLNPPEHPPK